MNWSLPSRFFRFSAGDFKKMSRDVFAKQSNLTRININHSSFVSWLFTRSRVRPLAGQFAIPQPTPAATHQCYPHPIRGNGRLQRPDRNFQFSNFPATDSRTCPNNFQSTDSFRNIFVFRFASSLQFFDVGHFINTRSANCYWRRSSVITRSSRRGISAVELFSV